MEETLVEKLSYLFDKHFWRTIKIEWRRVLKWKKRHNPFNNKKYSWFEAVRSTMENTPSFDNMWDEEMEKN